MEAPQLMSMDKDSSPLALPAKYAADKPHHLLTSPSEAQSLSTTFLSQDISISRLTQDTFLPFRRITSLLLPIRYPDSFFQEAISDPVISTISRIALYRGPHPSRGSSILKGTTTERQNTDEHVIGGIRCRLEPLSVPPRCTPLTQQQLYIQTLVLLSPYRGQGVATHLLNEVVGEAVKCHENVTSVYAHVWEANEEGLEWYMKRGFTVEERVLDGYYRRLKPGGARVVRRMIGITDHLRAGVDY